MQKALLYFLLLFFIGLSRSSAQTPELKNIMSLSAEKLFGKGNEYLEKEKVDSALIYYIVSSGKYTPQSDIKEKDFAVQSLIKAGDIFYKQNNYHKALETYFKGFKICENENIRNYLPQLYNYMGNIYNKFKDYERGKDYYIKGLKIAREINNAEIEWKILTNLVGIYCYGLLEDDTKKARFYYEQANKVELQNYPLQKYYSLLNLGYIYNLELKFDSASLYYQKSLDYAIQAKLDSRYISSASTELAVLYERQEQYNKALQYHLFSNKVNQESGQTEMIMYSLQNLSIIYGELGDKNKASQYRNQYLNLSDSIFNLMEFNRVKNSQLIYEMDKVNEQLDSLNAEKEESESKLQLQRRILLIVCLGLCLLAVMLIAMYIQKRKLENAYFDLFERNNEILRSDRANRKMRMEYEQKLKEEKEKSQHLIKELKHIGYEKEEEYISSLVNSDDHSRAGMSDEQKKKLIKDINEVMENTLEFCKCDFSLNSLATLLGTNTKYISQIINEEYNKNFRTFVNEYRIKEASLRLQSTAEYRNYTLKAIAESVGYKSHTTFISTFKKITGINPSTYKKIAEKQNKTTTSPL